MLNFELENPVKLIFGEGQIQQVATHIPEEAKVLVLYGGGSIKRNGVYEQVMSALEGHEVITFGGIPANPEYDILMRALEVIKEEQINFLLAVGGGSVLDGTKFLAAAALYEGEEPWDILRQRIRTFEAMPFGAVLTLAATGSEMNSGAVITRASTGEKLAMGGPGLFPEFSVLDPQVLSSLPPRQIANGIADSFVHVLEQYITYPVGAYLQDRFAESILQTLVEVGPKMLKDPKDYTVAANFMWCCTMALNGLIQKGVPTDWSVHAIGHELTALYGIDHARTLAIILPAHYEYQLKNKQEKLAQYGRRVWNIQEEDDTLAAKKAIEKTTDFFQQIGIKTKLSEYTDQYAQTAAIVKTNFESRGWTAMGERADITPTDAEAIVAMSY